MYWIAPNNRRSFYRFSSTCWLRFRSVSLCFLDLAFSAFFSYCCEFGCQYQSIWLPGKTRLWNELLYVEWDVRLYSLTDRIGTRLFAQSSTKKEKKNSTKTQQYTSYSSSSFIHSVLATCVSFAKMNNSILRMRGHFSAGFFRCVNTMVFVILLQVHRVNVWNR